MISLAEQNQEAFDPLRKPKMADLVQQRCGSKLQTRGASEGLKQQLHWLTSFHQETADCIDRSRG